MSKEILRTEEHPIIAVTLNDIGSIHCSFGSFDKALIYFRKAYSKA